MGISMYNSGTYKKTENITPVRIIFKDNSFINFNATSEINKYYTDVNLIFSIKLFNSFCGTQELMQIFGIDNYKDVVKVIINGFTEYSVEYVSHGTYKITESSNISTNLDFILDPENINNIENVYVTNEYISICSKYIQQIRVNGIALITYHHRDITKLLYKDEGKCEAVIRIENGSLITGVLDKLDIDDKFTLEGYKVFDAIQGKDRSKILVLHKYGFLLCNFTSNSITIIDKVDNLFTLEDSKRYLIETFHNYYGYSEVNINDSFITFEGESFEDLSRMLVNIDPEKLKIKDKNSLDAFTALVNDSKNVMNVLKVSNFFGNNNNDNRNHICTDEEDIYSHKRSEVSCQCSAEAIEEITLKKDEAILEIKNNYDYVDNLIKDSRKELQDELDRFNRELIYLSIEYDNNKKSLLEVIEESKKAKKELNDKTVLALNVLSTFDKEIEDRTNLFKDTLDKMVSDSIKEIEYLINTSLDSFYKSLSEYYENEKEFKEYLDNYLNNFNSLYDRYSKELETSKDAYINQMELLHESIVSDLTDLGNSVLKDIDTKHDSVKDTISKGLDDMNALLFVSSNGNIKENGNIIKLFSNSIEVLGDFTVIPKLEKLDTGSYKISNTNGLSDIGWQIEVPTDINGLPLYYVAIDYNKEVSNDVIIYVYNTLKYSEKDTELIESSLTDIADNVWIDLRFNK